MKSSLLSATVAGFLALVFLATQSQGEAEPNPTLTGDQVLEQMASAYGRCKSYSDSGTVKTVFYKSKGKHTNELEFKTAFVRPNRFRFEYWEKCRPDQTRYIIWSQGNDVRTWWDVKMVVETKKSLGLAIAGAAGVSSLSAHTVPSFLLPDEVGGRRLTDLTNVERAADEMIGDIDCYRVEGNYADFRTTVWVEKKNFLIRRIESAKKHKDFETKSTTTYDPVIDADAPEEHLKFNAPESD